MFVKRQRYKRLLREKRELLAACKVNDGGLWEAVSFSLSVDSRGTAPNTKALPEQKRWMVDWLGEINLQPYRKSVRKGEREVTVI